MVIKDKDTLLVTVIKDKVIPLLIELVMEIKDKVILPLTLNQQPKHTLLRLRPELNTQITTIE